MCYHPQNCPIIRYFQRFVIIILCELLHLKLLFLKHLYLRFTEVWVSWGQSL